MKNEYFHKFEKNISALQYQQYFQDFPDQKHIHIRTEWDTLFYSFTIQEIGEVQSLFQQANFKIKLYERYTLFLN